MGKNMNKKIFRYDGTNQHTLDAWIRIDTPEKESERVYVNDDYGNNNWHREKSNNNVRGEIIDGKGFSFFFARYGYSDKFLYRDESFVTNDNPLYSSCLASVPFEYIVHLDFIKNDRNLNRLLAPKNAVLLILDIESTGDIISATYTKDEEKYLSYIENRAKKLTEDQRNNELTRWLGEKVESSVISKLYDQLIAGYDQFKEFISYIKEMDL